MGAIKTGSNEEYEKSSEEFMELAEKGDPLSSVTTVFIQVFHCQGIPLSVGEW